MARRDEVLDAALELLDEVGLDALTVRRLAAKLGVQPGALYRHYPSKAALLDSMVDRIAAGVPEAEAGLAWDVHARWIARAVRAAMLARRDGARLIATFDRPGPAGVASWRGFTGALAVAGLPPEAAAAAADTVFAYVNGFTIEEQARLDQRARADRDAQFEAGLAIIVGGIKAVLEDPATATGRRAGPGRPRS